MCDELPYLWEVPEARELSITPRRDEPLPADSFTPRITSLPSNFHVCMRRRQLREQVRRWALEDMLDCMARIPNAHNPLSSGGYPAVEKLRATLDQISFQLCQGSRAMQPAHRAHVLGLVKSAYDLIWNATTEMLRPYNGCPPGLTYLFRQRSAADPPPAAYPPSYLAFLRSLGETDGLQRACSDIQSYYQLLDSVQAAKAQEAANANESQRLLDEFAREKDLLSEMLYASKGWRHGPRRKLHPRVAEIEADLERMQTAQEDMRRFYEDREAELLSLRDRDQVDTERLQRLIEEWRNLYLASSSAANQMPPDGGIPIGAGDGSLPPSSLSNTLQAMVTSATQLSVSLRRLVDELYGVPRTKRAEPMAEVARANDLCASGRTTLRKQLSNSAFVSLRCQQTLSWPIDGAYWCTDIEFAARQLRTMLLETARDFLAPWLELGTHFMGCGRSIGNVLTYWVLGSSTSPGSAQGSGAQYWQREALDGMLSQTHPLVVRLTAGLEHLRDLCTSNINLCEAALHSAMQSQRVAGVSV